MKCAVHDLEVMGSWVKLGDALYLVLLAPKMKSLQKLLTVDSDTILEQNFTALTTISYQVVSKFANYLFCTAA